jgi:hypothetical protein
MTEPKNTGATVSKFDDKLHKLIKRAKKERGLLWPAVVSKLELARIAKRIIEAAKRGERDIVQLRKAGLAALGLRDDKQAGRPPQRRTGLFRAVADFKNPEPILKCGGWSLLHSWRIVLIMVLTATN